MSPTSNVYPIASSGIVATVSAGSPDVAHRMQAFLEALADAAGPALETLSPAAARQVLFEIQKDSVLPAADVAERTIAAEDKPLKLTIVRPSGSKDILPAFMFFHGGGWIWGDFPTHERFVRDLVVESGAAAIFVNHALSADVRYPEAIDALYAATRWIAEHGNHARVDGKRLAVVGNSAGGNMAAVVALMAKQRNGPALRGQVLFWPVTNADFESQSYDEFATGHFLTRKMMRRFWDAYSEDVAQRNDIYASPLLANLDDLRGLPPALVITAEKDVLRDEGEAYARKLDEAGVDVVATRYEGMIHDFALFNALASMSATRAALQQAGAELRARLR